ncbi:hypothetical protein ACFV2S_00965 [Streptomyces sp. NPDC059695]|uniref:hypothetical protein n=1 Tax=unclassified Streptomyces TaxID=2593676 RepID=UPI0036C181F6
MESPTRRATAAGAAALLAAGLVAVVAGAESEARPAGSDRITTVAQLKENIGVAAERERQDGAAEIGGNTGGQATRLTSRAAC